MDIDDPESPDVSNKSPKSESIVAEKYTPTSKPPKSDGVVISEKLTEDIETPKVVETTKVRW